jgi:hypothetical protein
MDCREQEGKSQQERKRCECAAGSRTERASRKERAVNVLPGAEPKEPAGQKETRIKYQ